MVADRDSILDAIYVLNDIFDALVAGTMVFENYQSKHSTGKLSKAGIVAVQKMCVSHIVLGLSRLVEFWENYHHLVPEELRPEVKALVAKIQRKELMRYRNTVVAHIRDKKLGRVRTQLEAVELLNQISDNNPQAFLSWLNNPSDHAYPNSVVSIVERLRDEIRDAHSVSAAEVFAR